MKFFFSDDFFVGVGQFDGEFGHGTKLGVINGGVDDDAADGTFVVFAEVDGEP